MNAATKSRWPEAKISTALGKHPSAGVVLVSEYDIELGTSKFEVVR